MTNTVFSLPKFSPMPSKVSRVYMLAADGRTWCCQGDAVRQGEGKKKFPRSSLLFIPSQRRWDRDGRVPGLWRARCCQVPNKDLPHKWKRQSRDVDEDWQVCVCARGRHPRAISVCQAHHQISQDWRDPSWQHGMVWLMHCRASRRVLARQSKKTVLLGFTDYRQRWSRSVVGKPWYLAA